ncbi:MAG: phosphatidylinositol-specific phospholipase C/glycerophosphodiester phosphodiesterase family protein [Pirellulales bacterium]
MNGASCSERLAIRAAVHVAAMFGIAVLSTCPRLAGAAEGETDRDRPVPLVRAHAHNDYAHDRPLLDALDNGFCNVEADVFLVDGELLVAHSIFEVRTSRTLRKLYLDPLAERVKTNGGRVFRDGPEFTLMIDLKSKAEPTYKALATELADFADVLTAVRDGKVDRRAVNIVLSGNRPTDLIAADRQRFVGIDGRMSDLDSDAAAHLVPWLSDNWSNHFKWSGRGEIPAEEQAKLADIIKRTHARGRKLRFWAAPDGVEAWRTLADAGVDLINTDDLAGLSKFLRERKAAATPKE